MATLKEFLADINKRLIHLKVKMAMAVTPVGVPSTPETLPMGDGTRPDPPTNLVQSGQLILGKSPKASLGM